MGNILRTVPKKHKRKVTVGFLGVYAPRSHCNYLTLYCNAFEVPKQQVLKTLIETWVQDQLLSHSYSSLAREVAKKAYAAWGIPSAAISFDQFIEKVKTELTTKNLPTETIEAIVNLIKDEKNKDTKA
jgi:hypothetical protein